MLEYNADTPTALLEVSVAQWDWLEQAIIPSQPNADQFNSLHEKLIARWKVLHEASLRGRFLHFTCVKDSDEDFGNIEYLRDTAQQGGFDTGFVYVDDIGWASDAKCFIDEGMAASTRWSSSIRGSG
jgi:glutathionylspermidine synthase